MLIAEQISSDGLAMTAARFRATFHRFHCGRHGCQAYRLSNDFHHPGKVAASHRPEQDNEVYSRSCSLHECLANTFGRTSKDELGITSSRLRDGRAIRPDSPDGETGLPQDPLPPLSSSLSREWKQTNLLYIYTVKTNTRFSRPSTRNYSRAEGCGPA